MERVLALEEPGWVPTMVNYWKPSGVAFVDYWIDSDYWVVKAVVAFVSLVEMAAFADNWTDSGCWVVVVAAELAVISFVETGLASAKVVAVEA